MRVEIVRPPLNTLEAVNVFVEYVFGIVVDECTKFWAEVVDHASPRPEKYEAEVVENEFARYAEPSRPSNVPVQLPVVSSVSALPVTVRPEPVMSVM